ncbi:MAG: sulfatase-like hydrolase/transferase [Verrucomicrobiae bacterium]|nr:sulfatase-like hydrolase/transferase [Verrucomicrobiae bacterium]
MKCSAAVFTTPLLLLALLAFCAAPSRPRPNILFLIGDNWGVHASAYGTEIVRTPNFDCVAREGVLFTCAFCPVSSCTPTRSAILTGQAAHRLEHATNLWSQLDKKFTVYPNLLGIAGYGLKPLAAMTGRSFLGLLRGETQPGRGAMFMERERRAYVRAGDTAVFDKYPYHGKPFKQ